MLTVIDCVLVSSVDVNSLPDAAGVTIVFIFKSLSEIAPVHVPLLGCLETAVALRPGLPFNLGLTLTQ